MQDKLKIFLFTGKGGVGKSTLAKSFSTHLQNKNIKTQNFSFQAQPGDPFNFQEIEHRKLITKYLKKKLKSDLLASFIAESKFFNAIIDVLPNFKSLIFLGFIVDLFKDSESSPQAIVVDGPSTGHFLSLLSSPYQFQEIFSIGILHKDCKKIIEELIKSLHIFYVSLPENLNLNEMNDFSNEVDKIGPYQKSFIINQSYTQYLEEPVQTSWLQQRLVNEDQFFKKCNQEVSKFPFLPFKKDQKLIKALAQQEFPFES